MRTASALLPEWYKASKSQEKDFVGNQNPWFLHCRGWYQSSMQFHDNNDANLWSQKCLTLLLMHGIFYFNSTNLQKLQSSWTSNYSPMSFICYSYRHNLNLSGCQLPDRALCLSVSLLLGFIMFQGPIVQLNSFDAAMTYV